MAKTSGMAISVTDEERERLVRLCEKEGRSRKAQIMWLVDRRLDEIEKAENA